MGRISFWRSTVVLTACAALLLASCSDDEPETGPTTTGATSTTQPPAPAPYTDKGEYEVGTFTVALEDGRRVVIWYPAAPDAAEQPTESFDIASLLRPDLQAMIPADLRVSYEVDAHPGAEPASGSFPVVLFSHGFAGFPEQSVDLTTHLASWGYVVAAPDHVERSLSGLLGTAAQGVERREDADVLAETLDVVEAEDARDGQPAAAGSSTPSTSRSPVTPPGPAPPTAWPAPTTASTPSSPTRSGQRDDGEPPPVPDVPGMVMLGTDDGIIPAESSRTVFEGMATPKYLVELGGAGHLVFSDICLIGGDKGGVIAIADQVGIPVDQFRQLGTDGCTEEPPTGRGRLPGHQRPERRLPPHVPRREASRPGWTTPPSRTPSTASTWW